jgi:hypothetical protein
MGTVAGGEGWLGEEGEEKELLTMAATTLDMRWLWKNDGKYENT